MMQLDVEAPQLSGAPRSVSGGLVGDIRDGRGQWLGAPRDARRGRGQDLAEHVAMPSTRMHAMCTNASRPQLGPGVAWSPVQRRRRRAAGRRDDAVDADEDGVNERVEAARDEGATAERHDVADAVEYVPLQGPSSSSSPIPRRLQAHRLGSGRGVGAGQDRAGLEPGQQGRAQARALRHVVPVVPQELFLFAASVHENNP